MAATDEAVQRWKARCKTWEDRYKHERNSADQERDWARELEEENEALREQIVRLTALVGSDDGEGGGLCASCGGSCAEDIPAARGMPQQQAPSAPRQQITTSRISTQDDGDITEGPPLAPVIAAPQSPPRPLEYMSPDDDDGDEDRAPSVATASSISAALDRINDVLRTAPSAVLQPDEADGYTNEVADMDAEPVASSSTATYQGNCEVLERSVIHKDDNELIDNIGKAPHTSSATPTKGTRDVSFKERLASRLPPLGSPSNPQHAASASGTPLKAGGADAGHPVAYAVSHSHALEGYRPNITEKEEAEGYDSNRRVQEKSDDHSLASRDSILSSLNQRLFNLVRTFGSSDSGSVVGSSVNGDTGSVVSDIRSETAASASPNMSHAYRRRYQANATYTAGDAKENKATAPGSDGRIDARSNVGSAVSDIGPGGIQQHKSKRSGKYANFTSALMAGVSVSPPRPSSDAGVHMFAEGEISHDFPTIDWTRQGVDPPQEGVKGMDSAQASNDLEASTIENTDTKPAPISPISPGRKWTHPRRQRLQRAMEAKARAEKEANKLTEQRIALDPEPEQEI